MKAFPRKRSVLVIFGLVAALVISACSGGDAAPTATPDAAVPPTDTPEAPPAATPTPFPTVTPFPTLTPTPLPRTSPTPTPAPRTSPTPTPAPDAAEPLPAEPLGELTTITNDVFGFSVDVPVEWEATEGDPSLGELLLAAQADIGVPRVLIDLSFASSLGSVADLAQQALDRLQAIIPEVEVADEGPVTLEDGTEAYDYTIDFPSDTLSLRGKFLVIPRGSHIFQVFAETLEIDFETREPDLTRLARSFRLRPQVPFGVPKEQALNLFDFTPARFDPHVIEDIVSAKYATQVYGGLVRLDRDLNVVPDLAESIDVSPDGTVYTFRLRSGVQFHSGKPVTAQDVKYSVERAAAQSTASPVTPLYLNDIEGVLEKYTGAAEDVSGVEVIDDRTVRIRITQPVPFFLAKMTHPTGFVVNQENVESGDFWFLEPDGTGPFKVKGWNPGVVMALEAFQEYHLGAPKLPYVLVWNFGGPSLVMFEAGDMDVVEIAGDDAVAAQDPASTLFDRLQAVPQLGIFYVGFNANESPFDDPRARRAFALAIDKDLLIQEITSDTVEPASGFIPKGLAGFDPGLTGFAFDLAEAKRLWDEVLADKGMQLETVRFQVSGLVLGQVHITLEQMWSDAFGIQIEFQGVFGSDRRSALRGTESHLFEYGWIADYPDPQNFLDVLFHSESVNNIGVYSNAEVDAALEDARVIQDSAIRIAEYQRANQLMVADAAGIPLWYFRTYTLVQSDVKDWFLSAQGVPDLANVRLIRSIAV